MEPGLSRIRTVSFRQFMFPAGVCFTSTVLPDSGQDGAAHNSGHRGKSDSSFKSGCSCRTLPHVIYAYPTDSPRQP